jgi:hypothetical protein
MSELKIYDKKPFKSQIDKILKKLISSYVIVCNGKKYRMIDLEVKIISKSWDPSHTKPIIYSNSETWDISKAYFGRLDIVLDNKKDKIFFRITIYGLYCEKENLLISGNKKVIDELNEENSDVSGFIKKYNKKSIFNKDLHILKVKKPFTLTKKNYIICPKKKTSNKYVKLIFAKLRYICMYKYNERDKPYIIMALILDGFSDEQILSLITTTKTYLIRAHRNIKFGQNKHLTKKTQCMTTNYIFQLFGSLVMKKPKKKRNINKKNNKKNNKNIILC